MDKTEELREKIDNFICLAYKSKEVRNAIWENINEYATEVSREKDEKIKHLESIIKLLGVRG